MSKNVAIFGSAIAGTTTGEHHGHYDEYGSPIHSAGALTGSVTLGTSKIKASGIAVALAGAPTAETDNCGAGVGTLGFVVHKLRVNGVSVQAVGDPTIPHNGSAVVSTGSAKIKIV